MKVKDIMSKIIIKTPVDSTVSAAAKIMDQKNIGCLLGEEAGKLIGIITERDILRKIVAKGRDAEKTTVKEIMSSPLLTIDAEKGIEEANELMTQNKLRRLLIESNGEIVGIITLRDISNNMRYSLGKRIIEDNSYRLNV